MLCQASNVFRACWFLGTISKSNACSDSGQVIDHCIAVLLVALNKSTPKHLAEYEQMRLLETLQNLKCCFVSSYINKRKLNMVIIHLAATHAHSMTLAPPCLTYEVVSLALHPKYSLFH